MAATPELAAFLAAQEKKSLLRFLTCGSVDDGKSTLIGRLLYDSRLLFEDHLAALEKDSKKYGTTGGDIDFALLVDGLEAEREQGITIDVAYRFFATDKRNFIVADTPGHEQYTRNMATGASNSDLAVLLSTRARACWSRPGGTPTSRRSSASGTSCWRSTRSTWWTSRRTSSTPSSRDFAGFSAQLGFASSVAIPVSARLGDNVFAKEREHALVHGAAR